MKDKNKTVLSLVIILVLLVLTEATISIIFGIDYNAQIKRQYNQTAIDTAQSIAVTVERSIEKYMKTVGESEISEVDEKTIVPSSFSAIAVVQKQRGGILNLATVKAKSGEISGVGISDSQYQEWEKDRLCSYNLNQISNGKYKSTYKNEYSVFSKPIDANNLLLMFLQSEILFENVSKYNFENLALVFTDGRRLGSTADFTLPLELIDIYQKDEVKLAYITDLYVTSPLKLAYAPNLRLISHTPEPMIQSYVNSFVGKLVVLLCGLIALSTAAAAYGIYYYAKKYNYILFYNGKNSGNFVVKTDQLGKIKYANSSFRELFDTTNLFDSFLEINSPPSMQLANAVPIKSRLTSKNGEKYVISFLNVATVKGYKFVGGDDTKLIKDYSNAAELAVSDDITGLYIEKRLRLDYDKTIDMRKDMQGVFGILEPINTSKFEQMFGKSFHTKLIKTLSERVVELFDDYANIYINDEVFEIVSKIDDKNLAAAIPDLMERLNAPIEVMNNLIKVECKGGFTILDKYLANFSFDSVKGNSLSALRRALTTDEHFYIFHQSQVKLYKPYRPLDISIEELIANDSIDVYFQPQLSLSTGKICGFEALTRLRGTISQELSIQQFISISETKGDMIKLSDFIYERAMKFILQVQDFDIEVSLNVSPVQLLQTGFAENFIKKFKSHNLKPGSICLEITETFLMSSFEEIVPKLQVLKDNGIKIHLDDFGIAYSSMLYLKKLPISAIKIDREFIRDIEVNNFSKAITKSIIDITKQLNLLSIAEGIEELGQKTYLTQVGCDIIQGYLVGQAMPSAKAIARLKEDYGTKNS